jgi:integrase
MKTEQFPLTVTEKGVSAIIRASSKLKGGKTRKYFIVEYIHLGKRKQVWRSDLAKAKAVAKEACIKVGNGEQSSLELGERERLAYTRAVEILAPVRVPMDTACREYVDAFQILDGKASIIEACREWVKRNAVALPKISVADAVEKVQQRAASDKKSKSRQHELEVLLNKFADNFQCDAHTITPSILSAYLTGLPLSERSKRNHQDAIRHLNRWLVLHGYLARGMDWMEGVQKYSKRKRGEVTIYTPEEMGKVMKAARGWEIPFMAISGFGTIRHSELKRLDWAQVELSDVASESFIEILPMEGTKSDQRRRLIPVCDNLKVWLRTCQKQGGKVVPVEDSTTLIARIVKRAGVEFKKNALRHSAISYRVAQTGDVPRVADESGNSVQVIRTNYLRRVKPAVAQDWFSILPPKKVSGRKLVLN